MSNCIKLDFMSSVMAQIRAKEHHETIEHFLEYRKLPIIYEDEDEEVKEKARNFLETSLIDPNKTPVLYLKLNNLATK